MSKIKGLAINHTECASKARRVTERPTKEQLELDLASMPIVKVGQKYGVSDNAIRKWAKSILDT